MAGETFDKDRLPAGSPPSLLERTLIADHLLGRGYLVSDLDELPCQEANRLMNEALRFAALKLAEIEPRAIFYEKFRLPISRN